MKSVYKTFSPKFILLSFKWPVKFPAAFLVYFCIPYRQAWKRKKDFWLHIAPLSHVATVLRMQHSIHGSHPTLILHVHPVNSHACTTGVPHFKKTMEAGCSHRSPLKSLTFSEMKNGHAIFKQQTPWHT